MNPVKRGLYPLLVWGKLCHNIFMAFVPLETSRLLLRSLSPGDLAAVFDILGDEKTTKNVSWGQSSIATASDWLDRRIQNEVEYGYSMWGVERKTDKVLVGLCGFFPTSNDDLELGYVVRAKFQRKGYATEAAIAATIAVLNARFSIVATIRPSNVASTKVAEVVGLQKVDLIQDERGVLQVFHSVE